MYKYKYTYKSSSSQEKQSERQLEQRGENDDMKELITNIIKETVNIKNIHDLPEIIIQTMILVEKYSQLNKIEGDGSVKKELVISCVLKVLDDSDVFGSYENVILPMIPILIDKFMDIENGNINIKSVVDASCCCI